MPSLISSAMAHLEGALRNNLGVAGVLARGANSQSGVVAVLDTVGYQLTDDGTGTSITHVAVDLLIKPGDYKISGIAVDPARGDTWTYTDEFNDTHEYTVMFLADEPVFAKEPHSHLLRVHTKET